MTGAFDASVASSAPLVGVCATMAGTFAASVASSAPLVGVCAAAVTGAFAAPVAGSAPPVGVCAAAVTGAFDASVAGSSSLVGVCAAAVTGAFAAFSAEDASLTIASEHSCMRVHGSFVAPLSKRSDTPMGSMSAKMLTPTKRTSRPAERARFSAGALSRSRCSRRASAISIKVSTHSAAASAMSSGWGTASPKRFQRIANTTHQISSSPQASRPRAPFSTAPEKRANT